MMNQSMIDLSHLNIKEIIREYGEEEMVGLMNIIIKNTKKDVRVAENVGDVDRKGRKEKTKSKKEIEGEETEEIGV